MKKELYKYIVPGKSFRIWLLSNFDFLPDFFAIFTQYFISTGKLLKLKSPTRFTEKLQWYKLYYRNPKMTVCADKYAVRDYVAKLGLGCILVPLYGIYESTDDIDFEELPNRFVLKTTNGSHTNILCENKLELDYLKTKSTLSSWLDKRSSKLGREWSYYNIKPKIICEEFLEKDANNDLVDYKFFCFNGEPFCLYVIVDRFINDGLKLGIFDADFKQLPYYRKDIAPLKKNISKPENFEYMLEVARILSKEFPHVRVDLYNIDGQVYFGELTFYDGSGYKGYTPDEFDLILGSQFNLPKRVLENG